MNDYSEKMPAGSALGTRMRAPTSTPDVQSDETARIINRLTSLRDRLNGAVAVQNDTLDKLFGRPSNGLEKSPQVNAVPSGRIAQLDEAIDDLNKICDRLDATTGTFTRLAN